MIHGSRRGVSPLARRSAIAASGFTLLEVLLAMVLAGALMAGLWGILSLNMRTFEAGRAKTERAQLTRALAERIEDDLRSLAPLADEVRATHDRLNVGSASTASSFSGGLPPATSATSGTQPAPAPTLLPNPPTVLEPTTQLGLGGAVSVAPPVVLPPSSAVGASPVDSTTPTTFVPARVYSLVGSSHALRLRVLTSVAEADALPATDASGQLSAPLPRDLQIVEYRLEQPQLAPQPSVGSTVPRGPAWHGAGLTRRQRAWSIEAVSPDASSHDRSAELLASGDEPTSAASDYPAGSGQAIPESSSPSETSFGSTGSGLTGNYDPLDPTGMPGGMQGSEPLNVGLHAQQLFVPEVTGWQLRYFDGAQWHAQWHSARKGLPTAIEVTLSLRAEEPSGRRRPRTAAPGAAVSLGATADPTTASESSSDSAASDETMRLVVCLPAALGPVSARDETDLQSPLDQRSTSPGAESFDSRRPTGDMLTPGGSP
jgi:prepilin-type N-terminal cleavage/methylation domain-containing protein